MSNESGVSPERQAQGASAEADRAVVNGAGQAVSALRASVPSATWAAMQSYLDAAKAARNWTRFEFWLCPDLYRSCSVAGERPSELFGADVREIETWAWGWMLMVGSSIQRPIPYEPAQAIETRRAETEGLGAEHESAVTEGHAPNPSGNPSPELKP